MHSPQHAYSLEVRGVYNQTEEVNGQNHDYETLSDCQHDCGH